MRTARIDVAGITIVIGNHRTFQPVKESASRRAGRPKNLKVAKSANRSIICLLERISVAVANSPMDLSLFLDADDQIGTWHGETVPAKAPLGNRRVFKKPFDEKEGTS
jgi:hypothetical protein